jgi:hypothetical protein
MSVRPNPSGDGAERAIDPAELAPEVRAALERLSRVVWHCLGALDCHEQEQRAQREDGQ